MYSSPRKSELVSLAVFALPRDGLKKSPFTRSTYFVVVSYPCYGSPASPYSGIVIVAKRVEPSVCQTYIVNPSIHNYH
uniref:MSP domain-containing protein n=1 Tax=Panagrellus redivivus TaxID=6233 RepID=A0A7E5A1Y0_PANRE